MATRWRLAWLIALLSLPPQGVAAQGEVSLCSAEEVPIFSCEIGDRIASLCASPDIDAIHGHLAYRFGRSEAIDVSITSGPPPHRSSFTAGVVGFSGGGADYVRVRRGRDAYVVYSAIAPGWWEEGVVVERDGRTADSLLCATDATGDDGWRLVYRAGLEDDPTGFELPAR